MWYSVTVRLQMHIGVMFYWTKLIIFMLAKTGKRLLIISHGGAQVKGFDIPANTMFNTVVWCGCSCGSQIPTLCDPGPASM
jgi:hypothetical protein